MTINSGDIKLLAAAVMDDVPEGGGPPSNTEIVDGASNAMFPDISEVDRAGGSVSVMKVHACVRSPNTDAFFDSNLIVAEPFKDPRVAMTLFSTGDVFDRREQAVARMEAYRAMGATYPGFLYGNHLEGQGVLSMLQRVDQAPPVIGQCLALVKNQGLVNEVVQYVRFIDVTVSERTFTDDQGDFKRLQVACILSDRLKTDFPGFEAMRYTASVNYTGKTRVYDTIVADAAQFYGCSALAAPVAIGEFSAEAETVFSQLVPNTRLEVPIADARLNQRSAALVAAGDVFDRNINAVFTTGQAFFVGGSILPGSFSIERGGITLTDLGPRLVDASGSEVGLIDHANGLLSLSTNVFGTGAGSHRVIYKPAAAPVLVSDSVSEPVTAEGQRLSYVITLDPPPLPGSLQVSYRAQGQWYVLQEDGSGAIRGSSSSLGAGTLNPTTGTVAVTLGAMPDVRSALVYTYAASKVSRPVTALTPSGPALARAFGYPVALGTAIKPGTLSISWNDGTERLASDAGGVLTGAASGTVLYADGKFEFRPNVLPPKGTLITVTTTETDTAEETVTAFADGGSAWTATLPGPIKAGTLDLLLKGQYTPSEAAGNEAYNLYGAGTVRGAPVQISLRVFDDGAGALRFANMTSNDVIGSVNYATGEVSISKSVSGYRVELPTSFRTDIGYRLGVVNAGYSTQAVALTVLNGVGGSDAATARYSGADVGVLNYTHELTEIFLPGNVNGAFATGGVTAQLTAFQLGSMFHAVRDGDNAVMADPSPATGVGTVVGARATLGAMSGLLLTAWPAGVPSAPTALAGASQPAVSGAGSVLSVTEANFRTAVAPLVNSGFQIAGNWTNGGASFTATANSAGVLLTATAVVGETPGSIGVIGQVDYEMGLAQIFFGRRVPASMADEALVLDLSHLGLAGVQYVEVYAVQADTLRYNATGYSYLPLDAELLGMDTVRLPADGRVPIFRPGNYVVLGHADTVGPVSVDDGDTLSAGRSRLSRARLVDANGDTIQTGYTVDLDLGEAHIDDRSGWAQPVTFEHRIEDMVMLRGVQVTGQLAFTRPSTHNYPVPGSYVSSALMGGNLRARVLPSFSQVSWNSVWQDSPTGTPISAKYNDTLHPITTSNLGALTERWALRFTGPTTYEIIGEHLGVIGTGTTGADCSPMNPSTGAAYWTLTAAGLGMGWANGNVIRFNTVGAGLPAWGVRTVLQGPETVVNDSAILLTRGDVDRP